MGFHPAGIKLQGIGHLPYERDAYWAACCDYLGVELTTKRDIYDQLGYICLPTVEKMHRSRAVHRMFAGGNRSGKSQGGAWEVVPYLFYNTLGWNVSANYDMADAIRQKIEDILVNRAGMTKKLRPDMLEEMEFCYLSRDYTIKLWTGAELQLKSAKNPDSMHAVAVDYILVDEAALFPYQLYDTRLVPRLIDSGGWILNLGTFEHLQGEWFEEYYEIGQGPNDWNIESWCHPTTDNFHVYYAEGGETPPDIARRYRISWKHVIKMNPDVTWPLVVGVQIMIYNVDLKWLANQKKRIPKSVFDARYNALPAANQFLVFPTWKTREFCKKGMADFDSSLPVYLAVDPGGTYAVAAIQLKKFIEIPYTNEIAKGWHVCVIDSLYFQHTVTTHQVYSACAGREWWPNVGRKHRDYWDRYQGSIDVACPEQRLVWRHLGADDEIINGLTLRGKKVGITAGIETMQHYLDTHTFWVHAKNKFVNLEMKRYHHRESSLAKMDTADPRRSDKPVDEWNHLLKAIIYFMVQRFGYYGKSTKSATITRKNRRELKEKVREQLRHKRYI